MPEDFKPGAKLHGVGGVMLDRPFKIRRLGHFGLDVGDMDASLPWYTDLLGIKISDPIDFSFRLTPEQKASVKSTVGYFMRHGTDHHSFVLFPRPTRKIMLPHMKDKMTINQITWQVGSLREVVEGTRWLKETGIRIARTGRDNPGSNWHVYPLDPEGHTNEIYYGIEQIGWDGLSKPKRMHRRNYHETPQIPHRSEYAEVEEGYADRVNPLDGWRHTEKVEETYDVGGILLGRPFKVVKIGPARVFAEDVEDMTTFYRDCMGLKITEEIVWNGHKCVFLRANSEHHSIAIYPVALRAELGLSPDTTLMSFGFQVGDYAQLRDAVSFLKNKGVTIKKLPPELFPGMAHNAFAIDPDGHAIQLYFHMEQIGWDGRPMPGALRPKIDNDNWPETVTAREDTFNGEVFLGPWN